MDGRDVARAVRMAGTSSGRSAVRSAWRRYRTDRRDLPRRGAERARVPGTARDAWVLPGGGAVRFARSELRVMVTTSGAVFCGWDGAAAEPSYALAAGCPRPDVRAVLEPDKDGWRVISERVTVVVSHNGGVEFRTPGGVLLRRELPPRWWDARPGPSRWVQRSQTPADAEVFGLGGRVSGPRLTEGSYRLWNAGSYGRDGASRVSMPVQMVVADGGCHLLFHDNTWDGRVVLHEGAEGAGSGHDRLGGCEVRFDGGPLRYWVMAGTPVRVLRAWTALTGRPALPPRWALGYQHAPGASAGAGRAGEVAEGFRERGLALSALHLGPGRAGRLHGCRSAGGGRGPAGGAEVAGLSEELGRHGTRLVSVVGPTVSAVSGHSGYEDGLAAGAFVRDARGRAVRGRVRSGPAVFPDLTDPRVRAWWGERYARDLEHFAGACHEGDEPASWAAFGDPTLPLSCRHVLDGRPGDHREAHNVYGLTMAQAGFEGVSELRRESRPLVLSRSGWAGMQRYGGSWSGDAARGWAGPRSALASVLGLGLCGVPFSGPDAGGFGGTSLPELYVRWFQLAAYLPLFRTRSADGAGQREPWEFGSAALECVRGALAERERLTPYLYTLAHLAHRTGAPYVRPVWWNDPQDRLLRGVEDAFLLGNALLVAPVLEEGVRRRTVRLPTGRWYDTVSGRAYQGPGQVSLEAPLERVPVLARAGSVLGVAGADGGVELEVWAPAAGRRGDGVLVTDDGDGWAEPVTESFTVRHEEGALVVTRDGADRVGYRVRVRGESP